MQRRSLSSGSAKALVAALLACALAVLIGCQEGDSRSARSASGALSIEPLEPLSRAEHLGELAREPMLAELADGTLFLAGYGSQSAEASRPEQVPNLWRSSDRGSTWRRVDVGQPEDGAIGNSDVDLAAGPGGELYFASMGFDRTSFRGTHIAVGVSRDSGDSWHWNVVSRSEFDDRPWLGITPDGTAHLVWNDGAGVAHAVSRDRGLSWQEGERIANRGGSSHFAVGPGGELAVRIGPLSASGNQFHEGADFVAVSTSGGSTWSLHPPPGKGVWATSMMQLAASPRWVEPLAWDASGALIHVWEEEGTLWLARSTDLAVSWQISELVTREEKAPKPFFPFLVGGSQGLAVSWWSGEGAELRAHIAVLDHQADGAVAVAARSAPLEIDAWRAQVPQEVDQNPVTEQTASLTWTRDTAGEYLPLLWLRSGELAAASTVQNQRQDRQGFVYWRFPTVGSGPR